MLKIPRALQLKSVAPKPRTLALSGNRESQPQPRPQESASAITLIIVLLSDITRDLGRKMSWGPNGESLVQSIQE